MNKVFSKVWNVSLGQIVVASELARSGKKGSRVTARSCRTETLRRRGMAAVAVTALVGGLGFSTIALADFDVSDGTDSTTVNTSSTSPDTLEFSGDGNILVGLDASGPELTFGLADDVTIANSLTVGGISLTNSTLSFTSGGPSVSSTGIDAGSLKITNVADGALDASSTDAVNGGQLFATNQNVSQNSTKISDNTSSIDTNETNISTNTTDIGTNTSDISTNTSNIGANTSDISANAADITTNTSNIGTNTTQIGTNTNDISSLQSSVSGGWTLQANGDGGASVAPGDTVNFKDGDNIAITRSGTDISIATVSTPSFQGADMGGQKITNVGAGTADTDAVNVGQLSAVGGKVDQLGGDAAAILGGGASYDASTGQISAPSYTISMGDGSTQDVDNVGDALALMNGFGNGGIATGIKYFHARSTEADSQATGDNSVAIGPQTKSAGMQGYAAGYGAEINETSDSAVAIGDGATVDHDSSNTVVIGTEAKSNPNTLTATANDSVAIGHAAEVNDDDAVAVGHNASAGAGAVGIGLGASGSGDSGVAIGQTALAAGGDTIAMGHGAQANMSQDIAIGLNAGNGSSSNTNTTSDIQNVYIGASAGANVLNGGHNVAVGYQAGMDRGDNSDQNVAMGGQAGKGQTGRFNIAIGNQASSSGLPLAATGATAESIAIGREAGAEANGAISIGSFTRALGSNATTVGYDAYARAAGSLALGSHADAVSAGSIALGANSLADESYDNPSTGAFLTGQSATHILSIGAPAGSPNSANGVIRRIVNVAGGASGTDAVNVNQLKELESNIQTVVGSGDLTVNPDGSLSYDHNGSGSIQQALNNLTVGGGGSPAANPVQYDGANHTSVTLAGAGGTTISNVAAGTDQHDAVNVQQLNDTVDAAKVHYFSTRPVSGTSNQNNNKATGDDSLAVGQANLAAGNNSVAIGRGTVAGDEKGDDGAIAVGHDAIVNVASGIALGVGANAKVEAHATAIGHAARADGLSSIALGHNAQVEVTANPSADDGIAIGTDAYVNVDQGQAFGHQASAHDGAVRGVAIGDNAESVDAPDAYAVGTRALANASSAHAEGTDSVADAENAYAQGTSASAHATDSQAFGTGATTNEYAERSIAFGSNAATGTSDPTLTSTDNIAMGTNAQVVGDHSIAVGSGNSIGKSQTIPGGGTAQELVGNYSGALGNNNTIQQDNTFVVGNNVTTTQANSVVLGNASTDRAATTETGMTVDHNSYTFAGQGKAEYGVVSVGQPGAERQVINVAAGNVSADSTDAINGSQLYGTNQAVDALGDDLDTAGQSVADALGGSSSYDPATHEVTAALSVNGNDYTDVQSALDYVGQGWNVGVNGDATAQVKPGDNVNFSNTDGNVTIAKTDSGSDHDITLDLADDITVDSVTAGNSTLDTSGLTVNDGTGNVTTTGATGTTMTDGTSTTTIKPGNVTFTGGPNSDVVLGNNGLDNGGNKIVNVAAGDVSDTSTDAINGSQLYAVQQTASAGWNVGVNGGTAAQVKPGDSVDFSNTDGNLEIAKTDNDSDHDITLDLADSITVGPDSGGSPITIDGGSGTITGLSNTGPFDPSSSYDASQVATLGQLATPLTFEGDNGSSNGFDRSLGDTIHVEGGASGTLTDGNIGVESNGTDTLTIKLAENVDLGAAGSITTGNSTLNTDGLSVNDGAGNVTTTGATGTSVTDTDGNTTTVASTGTTITDGAGTSVTTTPTGTTMTDGTNTTTYSADGLDIAGGPAVTSDGIDAGSKKITNVADGDVNADSTDAVNGSQLNAVKTKAEAGWNYTTTDAAGTTSTKKNVAPDDTVDFSNSDGNIVVSNTSDGMGFDLADQIALGAPESSAGAGDGADGSLTIYGDNGASSANIGVTAGDPNLDDAPDGNTTRLTYTDADGDAHQVATMDDGLVFGANDGSDYSAKLGDRIAVVGASGNTDWSQFDGGQNIMTQIDDNGQITVGLAKDLTGLNSIQFGDSTGPVIGGDGSGNLKIGDSSGKPIQITNLASGMTDASGQPVTDLNEALDTNAANIGDLQGLVNANQGGGFGLAASDGNDFSENLGSTAQILGDGNITTSVVSGTHGHSSALKVSLSNDITLGQTDAGSPGGSSGTDGHIGVVGKDGSRTDVDPGKVTVAGGNGDTITIDGDTGTINGLTNTTWDPNNVTSDQAATEGQLSDLNKLINDRIDDVAGTIGAGWNVDTGATGSGVHEGDGTHHIGPKEHMKLVAGDNLKVEQDGGQITFALQDNINVDSVMANTFTAGDSAGNKTVITSMGTVVTNASGGSTHYGSDGLYFTDADGNKEGPSVSRDGIDAGGQRITNVKAGKNPTDAVNVKQLNTFASDVNQGFNELDGKIDRVGKTAYAGIASAAALAGLGQAYDPGISSASIGYGAFHGEAALAIGVSALTENGRYLFKLGGSTNTQGDYVTNGSMTIFW